MATAKTTKHDDASKTPDDKFYVVAVTNEDRLNDPCMALQERTLRHSETLIAAGMKPPSIISYPVEVYSLSYAHRDEFSKYGVANGVNAPSYTMTLYFFSHTARALAVRHGVDFTVVKEIRRSDLPDKCGQPVPFGSHFWHEEIDVEAYSFQSTVPRVEL